MVNVKEKIEIEAHRVGICLLESTSRQLNPELASGHLRLSLPRRLLPLANPKWFSPTR